MARWGFRVKPASLAEERGVRQLKRRQLKYSAPSRIRGNPSHLGLGCEQKWESPMVNEPIHGAPLPPCADPKPAAPFLANIVLVAPFGPKLTLQKAKSILN